VWCWVGFSPNVVLKAHDVLETNETHTGVVLARPYPPPAGFASDRRLRFEVSVVSLSLSFSNETLLLQTLLLQTLLQISTD
jgi:hypothetical protein